MYCRYCGQPMADNAVFCSHCGADSRCGGPPPKQEDSSFGFAVLGFFVPVVGLILFLACEKSQPAISKSAGKGALVGFITGAVLSILLTVMLLTGATSVMNHILTEMTIREEWGALGWITAALGM